MVTPSKLTPVSRFVAAFGMLPSSYKEAMTYEEQIVWLCNFLEKEVIPAINNNADGLTELQNLYVELKDYVDNYFDNLDIQAEVDAKIEDMVKSGQLEEVIAAYLQVKGVLGFDTVADMKAGTNFIDGSIARTLGKTTYNDKQGSFYYIRDLKNTDVIDEVNIIAITNYPDLVAEKIKDKAIEDIQSDISDINQAIGNITDDIDDINDRLNTNITIFIGDSYGASDRPNNWVANYCTNNGLTLGTNAFNYCTGSAGFYDINGGDNTYLHQIQNIDETIDKTLVTKIIVAGGWNDRTKNKTQLETAVAAFASYVKSNFPNAKLYVGMIANYGEIDPVVSNINYRQWLFNQILLGYQTINKYGGQYLNGVEEVMHIYNFFDTDNVHPNADGVDMLARAIKQAENSNFHISRYAEQVLTNDTITKNPTVSSINVNIVGDMNNGNYYLRTNGSIYFSSYRLINATDGSLEITLGTYTTSMTYLRYVNFLTYIPVKVQATFYQGAENEAAIYHGYLKFKADGTIALEINNDYKKTKYINQISILPSYYTLPILRQ